SRAGENSRAAASRGLARLLLSGSVGSTRLGRGAVAAKEEGVKKIEAIIKPCKLAAVQEALANEGVRCLTVSEVSGFGRQKGHAELYGGLEYVTDFLPKVKLEGVVADNRTPALVHAILASAPTGGIGGGEDCVMPVGDVVEIQLGARGVKGL